MNEEIYQHVFRKYNQLTILALGKLVTDWDNCSAVANIFLNTDYKLN